MKANLFISGNVQGVGYRAHAMRAAHQHHIRGFVKNLPDGQVEVYAVYDTPEQLQAFIRDLHRKSQSFIGIHVERIEVHKEDTPNFKDAGDFGPADGFQIRF